VSGLQYIADPDKAVPGDLRREIISLRERLEQAVAFDERPVAIDAKSALASLMMVEAELAAPEIHGDRVVQRIAKAAKILAAGAREARTAGDPDSVLIRAAADAAALCRIARDMWGG
jgi:hypothetical protein